MLGLDIDEKSTKLVEIKDSTLTNFAIEPGPPSAKTVEKLLKKFNIEEKEVYAALTGKHVVLYPKLLPVMSDKELREAIFWETRELISYPVEEAILAYDKIGERIEGGMKKIEVILVIIERAYFQKLQELLTEADLKIKGLTPVPFALWDLVKTQYKPQKEEVLAILDIGSISASFNLFIGSDLKFTREITVTGENITKALMQLNLDYSRAENLKIEEGFPEETSPVREKMQPLLEALSLEISQTLNYISEKGITSKIDLLFLTGGTSQLKNLDKFLAKNLGIKVEIFNPLRGLVIKTPSSELEIASPRLVVALGLAMGKTQSLNVLKLVKKEKEKVLPKIPLKSLIWYLIPLLFLFLVFSSFNLFFKSLKGSLTKTLTIKTEELKARQKPKIPILEKEKEVKVILEALWVFFPPSFSLDELTYERGKKTISFLGTLPKQEILGILLYNLQSAGKYKEVKLLEIRKKDTTVQARIELILEK